MLGHENSDLAVEDLGQLLAVENLGVQFSSKAQEKWQHDLPPVLAARQFSPKTY